jgi:hypothetical protein
VRARPWSTSWWPLTAVAAPPSRAITRHRSRSGRAPHPARPWLACAVQRCVPAMRPVSRSSTCPPRFACSRAPAAHTSRTPPGASRPFGPPLVLTRRAGRRRHERDGNRDVLTGQARPQAAARSTDATSRAQTASASSGSAPRASPARGGRTDCRRRRATSSPKRPGHRRSGSPESRRWRARITCCCSQRIRRRTVPSVDRHRGGVHGHGRGGARVACRRSGASARLENDSGGDGRPAGRRSDDPAAAHMAPHLPAARPDRARVASRPLAERLLGPAGRSRSRSLQARDGVRAAVRPARDGGDEARADAVGDAQRARPRSHHDDELERTGARAPLFYELDGGGEDRASPLPNTRPG